MASISFASESLMDPRIQVKLDKYQKCGNTISQTSLLSSYTGSETDADSDSRQIQKDIVNHIYIIGFLINVQGHHPHQWAPFQVTG